MIGTDNVRVSGNSGAIMNECSNRDIVAVRTLHEEIKKVLKAHERGESGEAMLQDIKVLCSCIIQTIRDPYCQERSYEHTTHLHSLSTLDYRPLLGHSNTQPSPMLLRRLILKSLEAFAD